MKNRPRIGITVDRVTDKAQYLAPFGYADAVVMAGGLPILLPYRGMQELVGEYLDQLDGVLLTGGDDLNPSRWGEDWHSQVKRIDPDREVFEYALLAEIECRKMPVLGICLGVQLMNVHRGGSIIQFLPDHFGAEAFDHRLLGDFTRRHSVRLLHDSRYAQTLGKTDVSVNTSHKQAINAVGHDLRVIASANDGVIEGIEDASLPFFMGVQWHPERQHEEPDHLMLFQMLVAASRNS